MPADASLRNVATASDLALASYSARLYMLKLFYLFRFSLRCFANYIYFKPSWEQQQSVAYLLVQSLLNLSYRLAQLLTPNFDEKIF